MSTTVKWGLITGMVYVIFSLISNMLGLQQGSGGGGSAGLGMLMNLVLMLATFFTIYLGVKEFRDQDQDGHLTMGEGFKSGMKIAVIAGVIGAVFTFIYMKFIDPDMADKILAASEARLDEMNVPEDEREMSNKITGLFLNPAIMAPFMLLWIAFWGIFKSLVAGAILKKEAPPSISTEA
jgi:amino acid transporter